jgi:hypothetical protein
MQRVNDPTKQQSAAVLSAPGPAVSERSPARWLKRLGAAGFAFFLFKGLVWLTLAVLAYLAAER